ncbi:MAG: hypothetical protein WA718_18295 [Terriglobales bacterium]
MSRTLEKVWGEFIVPVFIERFLLVVCAAAFYGMVISNNMNFDGLQRIGLGCALIGTALFLGATVYKQTHPMVGAPPSPTPPAINQSASDSTCSNINAGKDTTVSCSPAKENPDVHQEAPKQP